MAVYLDPFAGAAGAGRLLRCGRSAMSGADPAAEAPSPGPGCGHEPWHPCPSEPRVQGLEVSVKGKRNEASGVWRHSHVTPLHGVKLAQVTTLCQNGSRLCWLCQSQVKAGICSQEDGGSHPIFAAVVVGSSVTRWGPGSPSGSSVQLHVWQVLSTPQHTVADGFSKVQPPQTLGHHRYALPLQAQIPS